MVVVDCGKFRPSPKCLEEQNEHRRTCGPALPEITRGGIAEVDVRLEQETVWLSQRDMATVFGTTPQNIVAHPRHVSSSGELQADVTRKDFLLVRAEGRRRVRRRMKHYNLDAITSVGYRVNSRRGVRFRQWATRTLREHLVRGFTANEQRLAERGLDAARQTLGLLARTLQSQALVVDTGQSVLGLISGYADTWRLLLHHGEDRLQVPRCAAGHKRT